MNYLIAYERAGVTSRRTAAFTILDDASIEEPNFRTCVAFAIASDHDQFIRERGREIALGRLKFLVNSLQVNFPDQRLATRLAALLNRCQGEFKLANVMKFTSFTRDPLTHQTRRALFNTMLKAARWRFPLRKYSCPDCGTWMTAVEFFRGPDQEPSRTWRCENCGATAGCA